MKPREWEVMALCEECNDIFGVIFWVRRDWHNPGLWRASLEKSTTTVQQGQSLVHRPGHCGGRVKLYDRMPEPCVLEAE